MRRKVKPPAVTEALEAANAERDSVRRAFANMRHELAETEARADAVLERLRQKARPALRVVRGSK